MYAAIIKVKKGYNGLYDFDNLITYDNPFNLDTSDTYFLLDIVSSRMITFYPNVSRET